MITVRSMRSPVTGAIRFIAALYALSVPTAWAADFPGGSQLAFGEHVARIVCSACHVVAKDQEFPPILNHPAPDFAEIANRPGTSMETLQHFVLNTHWDVDKLPMSMPNPMLTKDEARAVSRYIMSLRKH